MITVSAHQSDRVIHSRLHMTTEGICPICNKKLVYAHIESHYSMGKLYGCEHVRALDYDADGFISGFVVVSDCQTELIT